MALTNIPVTAPEAETDEPRNNAFLAEIGNEPISSPSSKFINKRLRSFLIVNVLLVFIFRLIPPPNALHILPPVLLTEPQTLGC